MTKALGLYLGNLDALLGREKHVKHDRRHERPSKIGLLIGDLAKAEKQPGWDPEVRFTELVETMAGHDLEPAKQEARISKLPRR